MNTTQTPEESYHYTALPLHGRTAYLTPFAYWITQVGSPPVTATVALLLCGLTVGLLASWHWLVCYGLIAILLPLLFIIWLYKQGKVSDLHLNRREERLWPTAVLIAATLLGWLLLSRSHAPRILLIFAMALACQSILTLAITLVWKISIHSSSAATLVTVSIILFGETAVPLFLLIPLIAWSRVYLGRHTPLQTLAGTALGGAVTTFALLWQGG
jgi:membrane-associated phospholipid phosphatase